MSGIGKRIRKCRGELALSQAGLAGKLGVSRQTVSQWENDETPPSRKNLIALAALFDRRVSLDWLMIGHEGPEVAEREGFVRVPLIDWVQAGGWGEVIDPYPVSVGKRPVYTSARVSTRSFALEVKGDSMAPDFVPGDVIIVDPEIEPTPGCLVIAKLTGEESATFKKYRPRGRDKKGHLIIELTPRNEDWPTIVMDAANPGEIVGVVVEVHKNLRHLSGGKK